MLELWFIAMFVMQCVIVVSICCMMMPAKRQSRSRSNSGSSAGSSWDDEVEEETSHVKLSARKRQSLRRRLKSVGKPASVKDIDPNEPRPPSTPPPQSTATGSASSRGDNTAVPRPPSNEFPPSLVHNVTTYVGTRSGRAFHLEHCTVVRHRTHDVDRWDLCSKCFPVTPIRFPKGKGVMCLGNLMHSDGHCNNLRNIDMFGKVIYKVPCQSCISTIEH